MENNEQETFDQLMRIIEEKKIRRTRTVSMGNEAGRPTGVPHRGREGESRGQGD
jgi:hypothetical protein